MNPKLVKGCTVLSDSTNMQQLLKNLFQKLGWQAASFTSHHEEACADIINQKSGLIIIDDSVDLPAPAVVRKLFSNPAILGTPIIVLMSERLAGDIPLLAQITTLEIIRKPIVPSAFFNVFNAILRKWARPPFSSLIEGMHHYFQITETSARIEALAPLVPLPHVHSIANIVLAHELYRGGFPHNAEGILLNALKKPPFSPAVLVALADLYMHCSMPDMAFKFFSSLSEKHRDSFFVYPDLVQSLLLLNKAEKALDLLRIMIKREYNMNETIPVFLRVLLAEGRIGESIETGKKWKAHYRKVKIAWPHEEHQQPEEKVKAS